MPKLRAIVAPAQGEIEILAAAIQLKFKFKFKILLRKSFGFWAADFKP